MEVLFPVKFAIFSTENDLMEIMGSDPFTFNSCYSDDTKSLMHLVVLTIMIVSSARLHKTVVNTRSGRGTFVKDKDELPN